MKEYIEEVYNSYEELQKEIAKWKSYSIYYFEIVELKNNKWQLIKRLKTPMMG